MISNKKIGLKKIGLNPKRNFTGVLENWLNFAGAPRKLPNFEGAI